MGLTYSDHLIVLPKVIWALAQRHLVATWNYVTFVFSSKWINVKNKGITSFNFFFCKTKIWIQTSLDSGKWILQSSPCSVQCCTWADPSLRLCGMYHSPCSHSAAQILTQCNTVLYKTNVLSTRTTQRKRTALRSGREMLWTQEQHWSTTQHERLLFQLLQF